MLVGGSFQHFNAPIISLYFFMRPFQFPPALYTDFYELTMAQGYFLSGMAEKKACFDYFFRKLPFKGGYVVFAGLQDLLEILRDFKFQSDEIEYLRGLGFKEDFLSYLKQFKLNGSLFSVNEGEVIFPNEPVIRLEGGILETQIIETLVLNILNFESLIATKASRVKYAAGNRTVIDFGLRRAQGLGGIHASRAAVIGGVESTSNVFSAFAFGIKPSGTMAHSWVESFSSELEAFRKYAEIYPDSSSFLVDTYDTLHSGLPNAIMVAKEMMTQGHELKGIRLDSGDLAYLSKQARAMLNNAGLSHVKIIASNQLDEHIIKSLLEQGAELDAFGVGTNMIVGKDDAALDGVYKLSMFDGLPRIKISDNMEKVLIPGMKKTVRYFNGENKFYADSVMGVDEDHIEQMTHPHFPMKKLSLSGLKSEPLLKCVMSNGRITKDLQSLLEISAFSKHRLSLLPDEHKRFENPHVYKVGYSPALLKLRDELVISSLGGKTYK
jgi:nicotinate phosphoribosyltransferase